MEKIRQKPIEIIKTYVIVFLTVTMLVLAGIYIGGSQFTSRSAAINASPLPEGAVPVGFDPPVSVAVYEKDLLAISYAAIRYAGSGGGAYGCEAAASDLAKFAAEPIHKCLSSSAEMSRVGIGDFQRAIASDKYIYISLANDLPYQIIHALTGEYGTAVGSEEAINVRHMLLYFGDFGKTTLYLLSGDNCFASSADYSMNISELAAMSSDSRLSAFEIGKNGIALSGASPSIQRISLTKGVMPEGKEYSDLLEILEYSEMEFQPRAVPWANLVAPHGTVQMNSEKLLFTASSDSGIAISDFLNDAKSELDIDMYDVLLASVELLERMRQAYPAMTGGAFSTYISGFYHENDVFTVEFGLCDGYMPLSGDAYPYLARFTVLSGKFKSIDLRFIGAERLGYTSLLFSSAWEYGYAAETYDIHSLGLRFKVDALPKEELDARWYFTGEPLPFKEEVGE